MDSDLVSPTLIRKYWGFEYVLLHLEIEKHQLSGVIADRHQKAAIGRPARIEDAL
jgi:hypothetical protein